MNDTQRLPAIACIKPLRVRCFPSVDGGDWFGFAGFFARAGVLELPDDMPDAGVIGNVTNGVTPLSF